VAADLVTQAVLNDVGLGDDRVVENEQRAAQHQGDDQHREREPVEADAAGFERDDLVVLGRMPKVTRDATRTPTGPCRRSAWARGRTGTAATRAWGCRCGGVGQEFKEVEDLGEHDKPAQQDREVEQEGSQDVGVDDLRQEEEAGAPRGRGPGRDIRPARDEAAQARPQRPQPGAQRTKRSRPWGNSRRDSRTTARTKKMALGVQTAMAGLMRPSLARPIKPSSTV